MSSHHDHHDNHSHEPKPVAFRTPMILGCVTMFVIILLLSTCDKKHGHSKEEAKHEETSNHHSEEVSKNQHENIIETKMNESPEHAATDSLQAEAHH